MTAPEPHLQCPRCPHTVWISPEDQDTSLSLMLGHLRRRHYDEHALTLLREVAEVEL